MTMPSFSATCEYNVYLHSLTPTAMSGIVFLTGESMVSDDQGNRKNFGPEMAALAKSFKSRFSLWSDGVDIPLIYTVPDASLAPNLTQPKIEGESTAVPIKDWGDVQGVLQAVAP